MVSQNAMSATCVYCSSEAELTREHIVPNFLYRANPRAKFGFNPKADRFITWEAQIKDVCLNCNGLYLSKLDSYAHQFCLENGIDRPITDEKTIRFVYDFSLLSRFLLKVTFNCLRFKWQDTEWVRPFSHYILYGADHPANLAIKLGVEVAPCHKIAESERPHLPDESKHWDYMPPHMIRIGQISGMLSSFIFCRYVFVNNFCFYVIVLKRSVAANEIRTALKQFRGALPNVIFLDSHVKAMTLKVSSITAMDKYQDTANTLMDKWHEYIREQG
jgi:hypothetical protein